MTRWKPMIRWILCPFWGPFYALAFVVGVISGQAYNAWWEGWRL